MNYNFFFLNCITHIRILLFLFLNRNNDESIVISTDTVDSAEIEIDEVSEYFHNQCMYIQMEYCEKSTLR